MLMNRLIEDGRSSRDWTDISFFILGASTTITWDSIYMSISYFQQFLGKQAKIGSNKNPSSSLAVHQVNDDLKLNLSFTGCLWENRTERITLFVS